MKIKKLLLFLLLMPSFLLAQAGNPSFDHPVNNFLNRMEAAGFIDGYSGVELPVSSKTVVHYLMELEKIKKELDNSDRELLKNLLIEFQFEAGITKKKISNIFPELKIKEIFSEKEKYLYSVHDSEGNGLFINFHTSLKSGFRNDFISDNSNNAFITTYGGSIKGALNNKTAFYLKAQNGTFMGDRIIPSEMPSLQYNFHFSQIDPDNVNSRYFDETEGYLSWTGENVSVKIGRDRLVAGYGSMKTILSDTPPPMDYLKFDLNYSFFTFSYIHGKLLGEYNYSVDTVRGSIRTIDDKFWVYHRFGFNPGPAFSFGVGEIIIYGNRTFDLSYLNPLNFFKSIEHFNQDRDNSMIFIDFKSRLYPGYSLFGSFLIDDMNFSTIGKGSYQNQFLWNVGIYAAPFYGCVPLEFEFQYVRIEPYVFTHRLEENNYTSYDLSLVSSLQPNSHSMMFKVFWRPVERLDITASFSFTEHGANGEDESGGIINYGGDIHRGIREGDNVTLYFLDGVKEYFHYYRLKAEYEIFNQIFMLLDLSLNDNILANGYHEKILRSLYGFKIKL